MIASNPIRPAVRASSLMSDLSEESAKPAKLADVLSANSPIHLNKRGFGDTAALRDSILSRSSTNESSQRGDIKDVFVEQFSDLATDKAAFHALLQNVIGDRYDAPAGEAIRLQALAGDFSWMPDIKFVDAAVLRGAQGAYDSANDTVLILADLQGTSRGAAVLTEEIGHALDNRLNTSDTTGDEGQLFQMLLSGQTPSNEQRREMLLDNDHGSVVVNGEVLAVEFSWWSDNITRPWNEHVVDPVVEFVKDEIIDPVNEHIVQPIIDLGESLIDITVDLFTFPLELGQIVFGGIEDFVSALGRGDWSAAGQAVVDTFVDSYHAAGGQITDTLVMSLHAVVNLVESVTGQIDERPLSQAEINYLRRIYGNSIDYGEVTVQSGGIRESLNFDANVVGNDIFMPKDSFLNGGPALTDEGLVLLSHEMGHIWQFQNQGPEYIHTALADQHNHGSDGVGSGEAYDWLHVADQGVSFSDMGPEAQAELAAFIGQALDPNTGRLDGDRVNDLLREVLDDSTYWMTPRTWAIINEAHATLLAG